MFRRFMALTLEDKLLVTAATGWLLLAWVMVRFLPYNVWKFSLGQMGPDQFGDKLQPVATQEVKRIISILPRINEAAKGCFTCLMIAMAGKWMLNRMSVKNVLVLGVKFNRDAAKGGDLAAHAWLDVDDKTLLGGEAKQGYVAVASFTSPKAYSILRN